MGENQQQQQATASSRFGMRHTGGEIVEVQGGHIVRSTGRKDRHSKVCTAKGPRDRRVRLSAHTAIQFYDVQDRLGYDRPSKAVDWLINKAKSAIDELAELPAWNPTTTITPSKSVALSSNKTRSSTQEQEHINKEKELQLPSSTTAATVVESLQQQQQLGENPNNTSSFLPPSLDSDAIANTIKSFFPLGASADAASSPPPMHFQNYPPDLLSRTSSHTQDLRLSLQSFQDPILLHRHYQADSVQNEQQQLLFPGNAHHYLGIDGSSSAGWTEHPADTGRFQRMVAWNAAADAGSGGGGGASGGGFIFNAPSQPPEPPPLQPLFGQNQFLTQRGTLQSSNTPSIRAWIDPGTITSDQVPQFHQYQSAMSGHGFAPTGIVFSGFRIPGQIQGGEEYGGIPNKPSSASSDSRH